MSNTIKNEARGLGGLEAGQKGLSSYSINKKKLTIKSKIIRLRQSWHLEIADFERFAIFVSRLFLDFAPREISELSETFLLLYALAEDKATATDTKYSLTEIWRAAVQLAGGA